MSGSIANGNSAWARASPGTTARRSAPSPSIATGQVLPFRSTALARPTFTLSMPLPSTKCNPEELRRLNRIPVISASMTMPPWPGGGRFITQVTSTPAGPASQCCTRLEAESSRACAVFPATNQAGDARHFAQPPPISRRIERVQNRAVVSGSPASGLDATKTRPSVTLAW